MAAQSNTDEISDEAKIVAASAKMHMRKLEAELLFLSDFGAMSTEINDMMSSLATVILCLSPKYSPFRKTPASTMAPSSTRPPAPAPTVESAPTTPPASTTTASAPTTSPAPTTAPILTTPSSNRPPPPAPTVGSAPTTPPASTMKVSAPTTVLAQTMAPAPTRAPAPTAQVLQTPLKISVKTEYTGTNHRYLMALAGDDIIVHAWADSQEIAIAYNPRNNLCGRIPAIHLKKETSRPVIGSEIYRATNENGGVGKDSFFGKTRFGDLTWSAGDYIRVCKWDDKEHDTGVGFNFATTEIGLFCWGHGLKRLNFAPPTSSLFGGGPPEQTSSLFGGGPPKQTSSIFGGAPPNQTSSVFGGAPPNQTSSVFGGGPPNQTPSLFGGGPPKQTPSLFGGALPDQTRPSTQTPSLFGGAPPDQTRPPTQTHSLFSVSPPSGSDSNPRSNSSFFGDPPSQTRPPNETGPLDQSLHQSQKEAGHM